MKTKNILIILGIIIILVVITLFLLHYFEILDFSRLSTIPSTVHSTVPSTVSGGGP